MKKTTGYTSKKVHYWQLNPKDRATYDRQESLKEEGDCERFYFWLFTPGIGYRQMGYTEGYKTVEALKEHCINNRTDCIYRITRSQICLSNKR